MKKYAPTTPSRRQMATVTYRGVLTTAKPQKSLTGGFKRSVGRNNQGRITTRHKGGGSRQKYRIIDWKRKKFDVEGTVLRLEYDPNRTAFIALLKYKDGEQKIVVPPNAGVISAYGLLAADHTFFESQTRRTEIDDDLARADQFVPVIDFHQLERRTRAPSRGLRLLDVRIGHVFMQPCLAAFRPGHSQ